MKPIYEEIADAFKILDLDENWDGDGALKITEEILNKAIIYFLSLINKTGTDIIIPEINPCRDNSIDFSFRKDSVSICRLLINVSIKRVGWYGYCKEEDVKGNRIDGDSNLFEIDDELVKWINNNMKNE